MTFLIPHDEPSVETKIEAVKSWRDAAKHELFMVENGLCCGYDLTAKHNANLYNQVADEIEAEIIGGDNDLPALR